MFDIYSGSPLLRPPMGNEKYVLIRTVASCDGYIRYTYTQFAFWNCGPITGVTSGEGGQIRIQRIHSIENYRYHTTLPWWFASLHAWAPCRGIPFRHMGHILCLWLSLSVIYGSRDKGVLCVYMAWHFTSRHAFRAISSKWATSERSGEPSQWLMY